jgi:CheY-like chemotaxis protein
MAPPVAPIIADLYVLYFGIHAIQWLQRKCHVTALRFCDANVTLCLDDFAYNQVTWWYSEMVERMTYRILVVDDNDINLSLVSKILELEGYQVLAARNGMEAIQSVMHETPDLAILDVMMPDMDGYDLCRKLRQPPLNAGIPIVMLTAMNSDMEKQQALQVGANDVWSKPFDMEMFRKRIGELLQNS